MNDIDRGFIKWAPFQSLTPTKDIVNNILKEKSKIKMPILSDEEKEYLEKILIEAYYTYMDVSIHYYKNGFIKVIDSKIKKIDQIYKIIYLENNIKLYFDQILSINL